MIELRDTDGGILFTSRTANNERDALVEAVHGGVALPKINLEGRNLSGLDLTGMKAPGANLENAQASKTILEDAVMPGCNMRNLQAAGLLAPGADFSSSDMDFMQIAGGDLSGATLSDSKGKAIQAGFAVMRHVVAERCVFPGIQAASADIAHSKWDHSELPGAQFFKARAQHAGLENVQMNSSDLDMDTEASTASFAHADLRFSSISGDWSGVSFYGAQCNGMKVTGPIQLANASFEHATGIGPSENPDAVLEYLTSKQAQPSRQITRDRGPEQER